MAKELKIGAKVLINTANSYTTKHMHGMKGYVRDIAREDGRMNLRGYTIAVQITKKHGAIFRPQDLIVQ
jgi:hypothetical protein